MESGSWGCVGVGCWVGGWVLVLVGGNFKKVIICRKESGSFFCG